MTDRCHFCGLTGPEITVRDGKTEAFRDWFRPYGPGLASITVRAWLDLTAPEIGAP